MKNVTRKVIKVAFKKILN